LPLISSLSIASDLLSLHCLYISNHDTVDSSVPGPPQIRNQIGWRDRLSRLRGSSVQLDLQEYDQPLDEIGRLDAELRAASDEALAARAARLREAARRGEPLKPLRTTLYAVAREAAQRTLGLRPFDVQIVAALAMDDGRIVEMQTGEGKTLAAVLPAALNALTGSGVHVLTFNDYLARRDAGWMEPIYQALGLSVAFVQEGMAPTARRRAYAADVTYVTAKEAGFDHLRDLLARRRDDVVHRPFQFALIDEADSILIDEARVPLVIAGSADRAASSSRLASRIVAGLTAGVHYDHDEYGRDVELTDAGTEQIERLLGCGSLHDEANLPLLTEINCALHAHTLLRRDVDYLVRDGRIAIIDEHTGRVVEDRHWPDGLQAALEAKEGLDRRPDGRILGSITLQHFIRGYPRLCGMTGTAKAAAAELDETYGVRVTVIPTHRPMIRIDQPDRVYGSRDTKEAAVIEEIQAAHATGRPILVGTVSVEESERLAARLETSGVRCDVLNARNDEAEARIIAKAGAAGAVTISTNMAGRGTDIRLGRSPEREGPGAIPTGGNDATPPIANATVAPGASAPGDATVGLYVIGTNRHESERVDLQLRGRAGRQGDPGESRFFVSLEDPLLVQFGIRSLLAGRFDAGNGAEPITNPIVIAEVARAQRIVDQQNFEIRRTLARYSQVLEDQRVALMERRTALLEERHEPDVWQTDPERHGPLVARAGAPRVREAERLVTLWCIDRAWCDHLAYAADVREGIHLTALGGHDPLTRFTTDVTMRFRQIDDQIDSAVLEALGTLSFSDGEIVMPEAVLRGPSSTWTYLVNDDPFRNQIGMMLTGPGKATFGIGAALMAMPLLVFWGLIDRWFKKRGRH
jgi:preprotein translocase subunit SecA